MPRILYQQLVARFIETVKEPGLYLDGHGLYLQVAESASKQRPKPKALAKSWTFRYRSPLGERPGKLREIGLGSTRIVSLAEAREKAAECRKLLLDGIDPKAIKEQEKQRRALEEAKGITFGECAEKFIASHSASWKNEKHGDQWQSTIDTYCELLLKVPVQKIDTALVVKCLEPIWTEKPETASRLRGRMERILDWARVREFRQGENPARWRGHLDKLLPRLEKSKRVQHHPALPYRQMGAFIEDLRSREALAARALELTILCAVRTNEVIGMRPEELNLKEGVWVIPAERMKASREHRVPLAPQAIKLLRSLVVDGELVFPLSNMSMLKLLERMNYADDPKRAKYVDEKGRAITVHGFRSTFRDWAAESTGYPREVCEMALAHTIPNKAEAAYRRGDLFEKRRKLMSDWARYCEQPSAKSGEVIAIKRKGK
jgi:integrase